MTLSIIIVNYNVYDLLKNCIQSIYSNIKDVDYEIIVVDNNSPERDIENIQHDFPLVNYIESNENLGFAKANNIAFRKSTGKYLLLLNPDTVLIDNFVYEFIKMLEKENNFSACAPMLVYEDRSFQSSTGPQMDLFYELLESFNLTGIYRNYKKKKYFKNPSSFFAVSWASAACLLVKSIDFKNVNGFTESYFLNYEDIDLCKKLSSSGNKIIYYPKYHCIHLDHKSFAFNYDKLIYSRYLSKINYSLLHYSVIERFFFRSIVIFGLILKYLFSNILYSGSELHSRRSGYKKSIKLVLKIL